MELSGAVKLRNVSDYIAPNQACVVSLRGGKLSADDEEARRAHALSHEQAHASSYALLRAFRVTCCADARALRRPAWYSLVLAAPRRAAWPSRRSRRPSRPSR